MGIARRKEAAPLNSLGQRHNACGKRQNAERLTITYAILPSMKTRTGTLIAGAALVCGALPGDERLETAAAGILLFPTFSGTPEEAALAFLGGAVARDPNNKCNACGFQSSCSLSGKGGCGKS